MCNKPSNKKIVNWIKDHVTPHFSWMDRSDIIMDDKKANDFDIDNFKDEVKEKLIFGVKIKWRF